MSTMWTLQNLAELVTQYRYRIGSEAEFQDGLARVLEIHAIVHRREYDLGPHFGRIDFFLPGLFIGIELKVKGSPSEAMRQLHRYAKSPDIQALILVTVRSRTGFEPAQINSKPLLTASVWQGQF